MKKELKLALILTAVIILCSSAGAVSAANIYNITDDSYSNYFDSMGFINDANIIDGDVLDVSGSIKNKNMTIDRPLNLTSSDKTGKIYNGNIAVISSGVNITNLVIVNGNENGIHVLNSDNCSIINNSIRVNENSMSYGIYMTGSNNNRIIGNNITTTGSVVTHGIHMEDSNYNVFNSNNIQTIGFAGDADWSKDGVYTTTGVFLQNSTGNNLTNNVINTDYSAISSTSSYDTITGVHVFYSSDNYLSGNTITTNGNKYAYGLEVSGKFDWNTYDMFYASNNILTNNIIRTTGDYYANGLKIGSPTENTQVSGNNIQASATNLAYGMLLENYYGSLSSNIIGNNVTAISYINYVMELYCASGNNITGNILKGIGNYSIGLASYASKNNVITGNNITVIGDDSAAKISNGDSIPEGNEGIKLYSNSNFNTINNNRILSSTTYAVNATGSKNNTITNNFLYSKLGIKEGNDSVMQGTNDTVKDNYGIIPTANASIRSGLYNGNKVVVLTMNEEGNIYYTLDGTTPTNASKRYTGPISIKSTATLKFIAVDNAGNPSKVYTQTYKIDKTTPKITSSVPKNKASKVSRKSAIYVKFSEKVLKSTNWSKIYLKNKVSGKKVKISKLLSGKTLKITMASKRYGLTQYALYIPANAVKDKVGNKLAKSFVLKFKTGWK
ncbi:chitobiase/beta-hexosaminidase C-terminal domain-containing protein [Methanobacterium alcaliphilum]|uniref:chitobiase/beta-hexosaminidase C-terminal domain-containing protein n=1 Tax=Methanobacterium alcaliphilum TaxID=392018 RepID=UPI002009F62F|nr:chitobiase/beta-hexosaminidase C-terminal domain-containing protein [Methanobacterium alcaliphilum]MCK9151830.1 chitobiase/beta-hexosaminidase C-terminal domain-containing protein [Methanobacterium alcaliphilum]